MVGSQSLWPWVNWFWNRDNWSFELPWPRCQKVCNIEDELSPDLVELHATYVKFGWECIKFINDHFEELETHPLYAYAPVFIRLKEDEVSDLIQKYLEAYEAILAKLKEKFESGGLTRTDALIMSSMDRVAQVSKPKYSRELFLMGPASDGLVWRF